MNGLHRISREAARLKKMKRKRRKKQKKGTWPLYLMMLPGLVYILINNYIPMAGLLLAFKKVNYGLGIWKSPWVGLSNFTYLFRAGDASEIFRNTVGYNLAFLLFGTILSAAVAILLDAVYGRRSKRFYQTVILIPWLISWVIVSYIVYAFLSGDNGLINNSILRPLGMEPVNWYTSPAYWPVILVLVYLWKSFGYQSIMYYATLIGIDKTYYEAAVVDGASAWQQISFITLPFLKPTMITLTLLQIGRMFYSDFGLFYQVPMNSGLLYSTTNTIDTYVYRGLLELNDVGRSSAAGFLQSILGFLVVLAANWAVRRVEEDSALF